MAAEPKPKAAKKKKRRSARRKRSFNTPSRSRGGTKATSRAKLRICDAGDLGAVPAQLSSCVRITR